MSHDPLSGKHIVVMGFARQGMALARWLPTIGAKVTVTDMRQPEAFGDTLVPYTGSGVQFVLGDHPLSLLDDADVLCISGGVPLTAPLVQEAYARGITVSNDAQIFMARCPAPIIGITGSAGKTTTTTLVGKMCEAAHHTTYVGGNIGDVLLDVLPKITPIDNVVMELSSFQLDIMTSSPAIGAILNVTPNHLDRHGSMEAYTAAKANIIANQTPQDIAILGYDDPGAAALAELAPGQTVWFSAKSTVIDGAYLDGDQIIAIGTASPDGSPQVVAKTPDILLHGAHNVLNVLAACAIAGTAGIPVKAIHEAICVFRGVEHRQEVVRVTDDITWVNDSIATAPERVIAGLKSYDAPVVLLLGGKDKDLPWDALITLALKKSRGIVTFGAHGPTIAEHIRTHSGSAQVTSVENVEAAVVAAASIAQAGDIVLFSPGCTSYDAYLDFAERGAHFRTLVNTL